LEHVITDAPMEIPDFDSTTEELRKNIPTVQHQLGPLVPTSFLEPRDFFNVYKQPKPIPTLAQTPLKFKHISGREFESRDRDGRDRYLSGLKLHIRDPRTEPLHKIECVHELHYMRYLHYKAWRNVIYDVSDCINPNE